MHAEYHVLQCAAVCCSVLQRVLQCVAVCVNSLDPCTKSTTCCSVLQCVAVCCSVLQCALTHWTHARRVPHVAVCCSVLQCVAVCCSVLQCAAVCCSVLQCVAVWTHCTHARRVPPSFLSSNSCATWEDNPASVVRACRNSQKSALESFYITHLVVFEFQVIELVLLKF